MNEKRDTARGDQGNQNDINDRTMTLDGLRQVMRTFVEEREWSRFHTPKNLAGSVAIESAELLELFQWLTTEEASVKAKNDNAFRERIGEEMADVLLYLLSLANALDMDVSKITLDKVEKNKRKYPVEEAKNFGN
jgi:dCTP diphosphatase